ncbi:ABC transporter substrate-binding protein [Staphylococcus sp. ACRSN]|uniref:nickel ABC transporter substrate-binding protein n=1 Tax=Staphylococcus sp. ACRSN TaxID=2918214 RepID=UPI001EF2DF75|nr:nickel ABC transporter substrate-binding protein [Staphylococcus sp. ACRSN]MCG7339073.1 ABC transporter substrate-binding protein [Staphylococcus sp. ACRSN]
MKKVLGVIAASIVLLGGCSGAQNKENSKTLNVELPLKTTSVAPYKTDVPVKVGAAESLFKVNTDGKVKKLLVSEYKQVSPTELKLTVKDDIKFQNGKKVTGDAVKNSLLQSMKKSDLVKGSLPIKNIKVDGQNLTITTNEAYPELVSELASPFAAIYDTEAKGDINKMPVGTGPYKITEYKQSQKIKLSKNKTYWQGEPKLDYVNVSYQEDGSTRSNDLSANKADVITDVPVEKVDALDKGENTKISSVPGYRTSLVLYNHQSDKMNKKVREAFDKIIDREAIAKKVYKNHATAASGPFNTKLDFISDKKVTHQDIEQAKALLKEEGYTKSHPLTLTVSTYNGRPELPKIAQVIQSDAKKANINITLRNVDDIDGYLKDKGQWDASLYSFGTIPRGDTGYFFNQAYKTDGAINAGKYNNTQINDLIEQFNKTVDKKERNQLTNKIIAITNKDYANSYIAYSDNIVGLNKTVTGLKASPEGIYLIDYKVNIKK